MIIDKNTRVVVQGMTGKEGSSSTKKMLDNGTKVICGVTPGKKGEEVHGLPIFNSVKEAKEFDKKINTSVIYVPPLMAYDATIEAIDADIETVVVITENVPIKDIAKMVAIARLKNIRLIGPSSVGVWTKHGTLGSIGGKEKFSEGNIGIISKSGGMSAETALMLTNAGYGQSTVIGIGGDVIEGSNFADLLALYEQDDETKAVVIFGEIGGQYEEQAVQMVKEKKFTKPLIAFISGRFVESVERNLAFGHTGAILDFGSGTCENKKKMLKNAGAHVANYHHEIVDLLKKVLK